MAGYKGFLFLSKFHKSCNIAFVSSYDFKGTLDNSFESIRSICIENGYVFVERNNLDVHMQSHADLILVAGWQYLLKNADERVVIFHDSLLPKYRGFNPTVTALILGDDKIGVTALRPAEQADRGPIYEQVAIDIAYPIKIKDAYSRLSEAYVAIGREILERAAHGTLKATPQSDTGASYSIWRDERDYFIDWRWTSVEVSRFVDAVGWPYCGARTIFRSKEITIDDVICMPDVPFANRCVGKIWSLTNNGPDVVCGTGIIRVVSARYADGARVGFSRLRERLG